MAAMTRAIDRMASSVDFYRSPSASFRIDASMPAWLQTRFTTGLFCSYRRLDCSPPGVCYSYRGAWDARPWEDAVVLSLRELRARYEQAGVALQWGPGCAAAASLRSSGVSDTKPRARGQQG